MASYSTIIFSDGRARIPVKIEGATTAAALLTLGTTLKGFSNAIVPGVFFYTENGTPGTPTNAQYQSVKTKAVCTFRTSDNDIVKVSVPAPKAVIFNNLTGDQTVTAAVLADIATAMNTATGKTLTPLRGVFVGDVGKHPVA